MIDCPNVSAQSRKIHAVRALAVAALAVACSEGSDTPGPGGGSGGSTPLGVLVGPCDAIVEQHPNEGAAHVPACSEVSYGSNPPSSGNHYPNWAAFQSYDFAVPRGFLVHALEHGAVVLHYNCPDGCATDVEAAQAMIDLLPDDPVCAGTGLRHRVILTPDPLLDVTWAASAWDFTLRARCFSADEFRAFYLEHGQRGPENFCNQGIDFADAPPCP